MLALRGRMALTAAMASATALSAVLLLVGPGLRRRTIDHAVIHGETQHAGKVPRRVPPDRRRQTELIQLRQALRQAVSDEDYEEAARVRDRIRRLEEGK